MGHSQDGAINALTVPEAINLPIGSTVVCLSPGASRQPCVVLDRFEAIGAAGMLLCFPVGRSPQYDALWYDASMIGQPMEGALWDRKEKCWTLA